MRRFVLGCFAVLLLVPTLRAQTVAVSSCQADEGSSHNGNWLFGHGESACELRHSTFPLRGRQLGVAGTNGSIEVVGEDRPDIALEARVVAQGSSHEDALNLLHRIVIDTGGTIHATGPQVSGWHSHGWSVDFRLRVPRQIAADLQTENGSIALTDLNGDIQAKTTNGAITLRNLAGDVQASTVNGGLQIDLAGNQWHGRGMVAKSVNGAVSVKAPIGYSAHLIAGTVNGGVALSFPGAGQGSSRNHIDTNLGGGGATLQFETVNGAIAIARK